MSKRKTRRFVGRMSKRKPFKCSFKRNLDTGKSLFKSHLLTINTIIGNLEKVDLKDDKLKIELKIYSMINEVMLETKKANKIK